MIHELRTYTLWPGKVPEFLEHVEKFAIPIRGDDHGTMEGFWSTEFGPLNQVLHLWSYADLNDRQDARARLTQNPDWTGEVVPRVIPLIRRQEVRLMHPRVPLKGPAGKGNIYEYRHYSARPGKAGAFVQHFTEAMPVREKYSPNVCLWHSEAANPNEVSHLWVYSDFASRAEARAKCAQDPDWRAFLGKGGPLLE
ncbi:MAG: NIPSNAP family protein, partial [Alphaproteobacteria bacterium]|nr:NIPSNAP family protein [Alphaproteobacteria bacterium]